LIAIVSDLHANLEATHAVMADIEEHGATDEIVCLGDIIGYGPNPCECLDIAMDFKTVVQGNHEKALLMHMDAANFNETAKGSIEWTRDQMDMLSPEKREANAQRWDFMGDLEDTHKNGEIIYVHGTPRYPAAEYLYKSDLNLPGKMSAIFSFIDHICFNGHTHMPGIWTDDLVFISTTEANYRYRVTRKKTIINVGSVGQPRDGDTRACYVLLDGDKIIFRRVEYPFRETAAKIKAIPQLNPALAYRLSVAR